MKIFVKDCYLHYENKFGSFDQCSVAFSDQRILGNESIHPEVRNAAYFLTLVPLHKIVKINAEWDGFKWIDIDQGEDEDVERFIVECRRGLHKESVVV